MSELGTKEELETPRSAASLLPWVLMRINEISMTSDGKRAIRLHEGHAKELVEEILSIAWFAHHHFGASEEVLICPQIGSQNFDASVDDSRECPSPVRFIEATQARDGELDYLRMLHLERHGRVPGAGPIKKEGSKRDGIVTVPEGRAFRINELVANQIRLIRAAIERKRRKKGQYPPRTALVIVLDDWVGDVRLEIREAVFDLLQAEAIHSTGFCWIAAVSWSGKTIVDRPVP